MATQEEAAGGYGSPAALSSEGAHQAEGQPARSGISWEAPDLPEAPRSRVGGVVWEVQTGAKPAAARPKAAPRPPRWAAQGQASYGRGVRRNVPCKPPSQGMTAKRLANFKAKQLETLETFRKIEQSGVWDRLHRGHFDWWMFPIDDGSKPDFNVSSEADVEALRSDSEWLDGYREAVRLVATAWGWDVDSACRIDPLAPGMGYTGWDVRLAKICRSLFLFEQESELSSMQKFAREVQQKEKAGANFFYGTICLDELLYFELPRRAAPAEPPAPAEEPEAA
eukprot:TRINITY_DN100407_c0_g1_i1.p1 TRINITY_DN100407_c0_g1~~TRINITY_DN100407_c0_g1_i1.p1  ORF type:complete len:296 (-),score=70.67 TRINITY_DN100407_c0_g1_i1:54-896(-)